MNSEFHNRIENGTTTKDLDLVSPGYRFTIKDILKQLN
jgi:hypothetical protein